MTVPPSWVSEPPERDDRDEWKPDHRAEELSDRYEREQAQRPEDVRDA